MSWKTPVTYYKIINETIKEKLGGLHYAKLLLYSVDFDEIERCRTEGDRDKNTGVLTHEDLSLERGGADFIIICTNTVHKVVPQI